MSDLASMHVWVWVVGAREEVGECLLYWEKCNDSESVHFQVFFRLKMNGFRVLWYTFPKIWEY